jgi:hypothetical protein
LVLFLFFYSRLFPFQLDWKMLFKMGGKKKKTTCKYTSTSMTIGAAAAARRPKIDWPGEDK